MDIRLHPLAVGNCPDRDQIFGTGAVAGKIGITTTITGRHSDSPQRRLMPASLSWQVRFMSFSRFEKDMM